MLCFWHFKSYSPWNTRNMTWVGNMVRKTKQPPNFTRTWHGGTALRRRANSKFHMMPLASCAASVLHISRNVKQIMGSQSLSISISYVLTVCASIPPSKPGRDKKVCHSCIRGLDVRKLLNLRFFEPVQRELKLRVSFQARTKSLFLHAISISLGKVTETSCLCCFLITLMLLVSRCFC